MEGPFLVEEVAKCRSAGQNSQRIGGQRRSERNFQALLDCLPAEAELYAGPRTGCLRVLLKPSPRREPPPWWNFRSIDWSKRWPPQGR